MSHPYDARAEEGEETLRGVTDAVSDEIAQAMLQRQHAGAIIAAREKIVEGAVSMVEGALSRLEEENVVELNCARRCAGRDGCPKMWLRRVGRAGPAPARSAEP